MQQKVKTTFFENDSACRLCCQSLNETLTLDNLGNCICTEAGVKLWMVP